MSVSKDKISKDKSELQDILEELIADVMYEGECSQAAILNLIGDLIDKLPDTPLPEELS